jgi:Glucodextranase, domain B
MLGVAIPGIAPLRPGEGTVAAPDATLRRRGPLPRGVDGPLPSVVPAPAPMAEVPAPPPPRVVRKRGVPLVAVALVAGAIVVIGGASIALLWRGAPPISALPKVTPDGTDLLHLTCDPTSCKDGTVVTVDGAPATFAAGAADLPLARPLHVGQNALSLHVDRPGMGRDEVIALSVPVAYRVRADVSGMSAPHPSLFIHVEAVSGSDVRVADKAVTLDAGGVGTYAIDESAATEGPADESHILSVDVPYTVASAGHAPEAGTVSARVAIAPLRVDAPGERAVVEDDHVLLAGRAAKGATVTVDGAAASVEADGTFEKSVPLSALGEVSVEVRSGTATLAPRTVHIALKRVARLSDEARAFEKQPTLGYDAALANLASDAGRAIVVDGEVVEPRASGHRTLLLVDDHRGCSKGPCLARVVVGQELAVARGDRLRAYGRVARAFTTPAGQTVPEIEADFVLRPKR